MIYNLARHLKDVFTTETIYTNAYELLNTQSEVPDRLVLIQESGGTESAWFNFVRKNVQVITRDFETHEARALAWEIYKEFSDKGRFGLTLPAETVDGVTFPAIQMAQISPIQQPAFVGADDRSLKRFSFNLQIIYKRET